MGIVWLLILKCLQWHCYGELGVYTVVAWRCLNLPSKFIKLWCFLRILPVLHVVLSRMYALKTLDFIKISKNEGFGNIGNIANHYKLMFPVMFASITLKYTNQTVHSATCPFSLYTRHELDVQKTFTRSRGHLLNVLCTFNLHPLSSGSMALSTSHW